MKEQIKSLIEEKIKLKGKYLCADTTGVYISGQIKVLQDLLIEIDKLKEEE